MRIDDNTHRMVTGAGADGELRIVGGGGSGADEHRVGERPQPVEMEAVLRTGDVVGVAGAGGDEPVQALAELGHHQPGPGQAQGGVARGEFPGFGCGGLPPPVRTVRVPDQTGRLGFRSGPDRAQQVPRARRVEFGGAVRHRVSSRAPSKERYSWKESTRPAKSSFPFSADAREGLPMTPDSV